MSDRKNVVNRKQGRPDGNQSRTGGLLYSGHVPYARVKNPVLTEDLFEEPLRQSSSIARTGTFIRFFDDTDSLLKAINAVFNTSPTLRSIILQKVTLIMGDGFLLMEGRPNSLFSTLAKAGTAVEDPTKLEAIDERLMSVNADGETIAEVTSQALVEFETYGNAFVCLARPVKKKADLQCYVLPMVKTRLKELLDDDAGIRKVGVNREWKTAAWESSKVKQFPLYPNWSEPDADGIERTVIHIKNPSPGFEYYGLPEWISALEYAGNEYRISKHNAAKLKNRNRPNGILQFFGAVSQDEAKEVVKQARAEFGQLGTNDGLLIQVLSNESLKASFTPLETETDGNYLELARVCAQAIVSANRWTMSLAGFATKGQLGSNEQIRREFEIVYNTVIRPKQNLFCRRFLNVYLKELATEDKDVAGVYIDISSSTPVSFIGDITIDQVLTNDEKRQIAGYEPLPQDSNEDAKLRDTVSAFSPLVANKMIDKLQPNEIRQLLGFPAIEGDVTPEPQPTQPTTDNGSADPTDTDSAE